MLNPSHDITSLGYFKVLSFYKFADRDLFQVDSSSMSADWIRDNDRTNLDVRNFMDISQRFDKTINLPKDIEKSYIVDTILHLYKSDTLNGPQLTVPVASLADSTSFTMEFWMSFDEFNVGNFSILGMSGESIGEGFSIAGRMTAHMATMYCIVDKYKSDIKYATNSASYSIRDLNTWHHIACSRFPGEMIITENKAQKTIETQTGELIVDDIIKSVTTHSEDIYDCKISALFSPGNLLLGTRKYNGEPVQFAGFIRELRLWNSRISINEINNLKTTMLDPMKHYSLVGYWPLISGSANNFFEISGRSIQDVSFGTSNPNSAKAYGETSSEWITATDFQTLPICHVGYTYRPQSASCVGTVDHLALYFSSSASNCGLNGCTVSSNKPTLTSWDATFSIWVYYSTEVTLNTLLVGIKDFLELYSAKTGMYITYQRGIKLPVSEPVIITHETRKWIYYAVAMSEKGEYAVLVKDEEHNELEASINNVVPTTNIFSIGNSLNGYIREVKLWNECLVDYDNTSEKYDFTKLMYEKYS